ncbi:hypothetical protein KPL35_05245 [Clostridium sp. CF011]|uniref:hypothetical protein n=1 Tax=Clostridium sp. CF011 TaxID=2843318 RepID=UPI001C0DF844|nr:hypothetical protein [Clostridium sp. CF011]MBU3091475.1 hypothetical protein [Clostridium sp. CF011]WAG69283.1 hypothetical protein LL036_14965 [Clostridium sp. CF011]
MSNVESDIKENLKLSKSLTEENDRIFTDIVCYLRVSNLSDEEQEEIISDILRMFLDWQEEGNTVKSMLGEDYKKFADNIISAVNPKTHVLKTIKKYLGLTIEGFCMIFTVDFIFLYLPKLAKGSADFNVTYDYTLSMLLNGLIAVAIFSISINYIGKNAFELSKKHYSNLANFIFGCSAMGLIILLLLSSKLSPIIVFSINIRYIIGIIAVYWVYKGVKKIMKSKVLWIPES